jgi:Ca2+/Na+ antiporter
MMSVEYIIVGAAICICAFVLLVFSWLSYRKYHNQRLLFVLVVFLFFLIRGTLFSLSIFYEPLAGITTSIYPWLIDLVILNLLYLSALKR